MPALKVMQQESGMTVDIVHKGQTPMSPGVQTCSGCSETIHDRFLLFAVDRYWHTGCLRCSCCYTQLGDIGTSCFTRSGMILCKSDYLRMFCSGGTCSACSQKIPASEMVMKVQGHTFHMKCFCCTWCRGQLVPGDRYGLVNGSVVCERDYSKSQSNSRTTTPKVSSICLLKLETNQYRHRRLKPTPPN